MTDSTILGVDMLKSSIDAIKARHSSYGSPVANFERIAALWNAYLDGFDARDKALTTVDVAILMALVKIGRLIETPDHVDSWVDIAGYAACGREVSAANLTRGSLTLGEWQEKLTKQGT